MSSNNSPRSLFQKVLDAYRVRELPSGQTQLLIGSRLIHEVTSPQAFAMLRELGLPVRFPKRTFLCSAGNYVGDGVETDSGSLVIRCTARSNARGLALGRQIVVPDVAVEIPIEELD